MENKKMQAQGKYILGLDIGPNSIGWAVLDCITEGGQPRPAALRDLNSYIFLSGVDEAGKPRNAERREKRLAGRQIWRRAKRRQVLAEKLKECGLLPEKWQTGKSAENTEIANGIDKQFAAREKPPDDNRQWANPFAMRAFALDYALTPHELGRVILHLQKHRGYFSNRGAKYLPLLKHLELNDRKIRREETGEEDARRGEKAETGEKEKRLVLGGIGELEKILGDGEYRALGEYLWKNPKRAAVRITRLWTERKIEKGKKAGETERVYFYAAREMVEVEFDKLRKTQKAHTKIGGEVWDEIRNILFEQYPVQNPPPKKLLKKKPGDLRTFRQDNLRYNAVGDCGVVPDKKRAAAARLESQEFRTRAVIANIEADGEKLDCRLRQKLYSSSAASTAKLNQSGRLSWTEAGKILGGKKITNYGQDEDGKNGLVANRTGRAVCEITGEEIWRKMGCNEYLADGNAMQKTIAACKKQNRTQQYALVEDLLSYTCKLGLYQRLTKHWQFAPGAGGGAYNLAVLELESGYMKYSAAAINRMLKYMRPKSESGEGEMLDEYEACEKIKEKIKPRGGKKDGGAPDKLPLIKQEDLPDTANPRVERGLYAVRRIVNALVKKHGAPAQIRLEMARDLKNSKKHRAEIERRQKQNSKNNENAEREMREMPEFAGGARIYPKDRERYKIWIYEQGKKCVYCGGDIANPFGAEIDHIYPRASFSQNFGNIVVACQNCNQTKGKQTPWEAFSGNREKWRGIELRLAPRKQIKKKNGEPEENGEPAMKLSAAKRKRILSRIKTAELKSAEELTNRALNDTQYLITAAAESLRGVAPVRAGAGQATAQLRRVWDLDKILPREDETMRGKNRGDQRHHAVDAFVVALTEPGILRELVKINQKEQDGEFSEDEKENARLAEDARRNIAPPKSWAGGKTAAAVKEK
ncbi:MAG: type II CRISPR RNA-guided endonuclease Cas9, partial [Betaproteobacteria bacterium]|nr:type II CRISPR RNA-guided endonuclease Cas9 [Betaproteobacteria bacterium]